MFINKESIVPHAVQMQARILCVYDEGALEDTPYIGARGLSILIDVDGQRTLLDTGMRSRYLSHNLNYLDVDSESISSVAISNSGKDHVGGLEGLLDERNSSLNVYLPASSVGVKRLFRTNGVHIASEYSELVAMNIVDDWVKLSDNLWMSPPMLFDGGDECFLVLTTRKGPVVLSGCSRCGVNDVIQVVKRRFGSFPIAYIGGVMLGKKEKLKAQSIAEVFKSSGCLDLSLNHCTSRDGMTELRVHLGLDGVKEFYVGMHKEYEV